MNYKKRTDQQNELSFKDEIHADVIEFASKSQDFFSTRNWSK